MKAEDDGVETGMDAMDLAYLTAHGAYTQFNVTWEYEKNPNGSWKKKGGKRVRIPGTRQACFQIVIPYWEGEERKQRKRERSAAERSAAKQEAKQKKLASFFGYTNEENPFHDSNLTGQFVWRKKHEKTGEAVPNKRQVRKKREQLVDEITKVRERRDQREEERAEMERLREEEQRMREAEQLGDWQAKEEE